MFFNLVIIYRVYPGISKSPIFENLNKLQIVEKNLMSFSNSIKKNKIVFHAILDDCDKSFEDCIRKNIKGAPLHFHNVNFKSNEKTFELQLQIASMYADQTNILLLEDDYIFKENCITAVVKFLEKMPGCFCTPFDSIDYYNHPMHQYKRDVILIGQQHWQSVCSTTFTFAAKKELLMRYRNQFLTFKYKNNDTSVWISITKKISFQTLFSKEHKMVYLKKLLKMLAFTGYSFVFSKKAKLYASVPSLAAHLESSSSAPDIMDY